MIFNSFRFLYFLPTVFILYWFVAQRKLKAQNILLLVASYFFYACWNYKFLFLLIFSTLLDYFTGLQMEKSESREKKRFWFWFSIIINLGFLGLFKYYNFFVSSFIDFLSLFGIQGHATTLNVILPVGISFYTFHGLSYVIDIFYNRIKAEKNFVDYSVFVSFFPLLVAGPIERATHLLPQIKQERSFDPNKAADGLRQILWGLFMKVVVADNCALIVNEVFKDHHQYNAGTLWVGAMFFSFQIYGDFAGYSNIALGTARLLGFELLKNFSFPYFSRDIAEFWRRWHISLSSWFRDYLYIPLGGSKGGLYKQIRNVMIIFLVSGLWHGANWTFIIWGGINALCFIPLVVLQLNRSNTDIVAQNSFLPNLKEVFQMLLTFSITVLAWVFFRSFNVTEAIDYLIHMFDLSRGFKAEVSLVPFGFIGLLLVVEWIHRDKNHGFEISYIAQRWIRWAFYLLLFLLLIIFGASSETFIYFQF
jgi:alginate O-acetyltransferase complex protein AlgI